MRVTQLRTDFRAEHSELQQMISWDLGEIISHLGVLASKLLF